jgi:hypothetical protein
MPHNESASPLPWRIARSSTRSLLNRLRNFWLKQKLGPQIVSRDTRAPGKIFDFTLGASRLAKDRLRKMRIPVRLACSMLRSFGGVFDLMIRPLRSSRPETASSNLEKKIQDALNESRILVLGVQVLLSFQYTSVLENAFVKLPLVAQRLELIALGLLLLTFGLLVSPAPYHPLVWRSENSEDLQTYVSTIVKFALLPFAVALAIDVYISVEPVTGELIAALLGSGIFWLRCSSGTSSKLFESCVTAIARTPMKEKRRWRSPSAPAPPPRKRSSMR